MGKKFGDLHFFDCSEESLHCVCQSSCEKKSVLKVPVLKYPSPTCVCSCRIIHLNLKNEEMNLSNTRESYGIKLVSNRKFFDYSRYYCNLNVSLFKFFDFVASFLFFCPFFPPVVLLCLCLLLKTIPNPS